MHWGEEWERMHTQLKRVQERTMTQGGAYSNSNDADVWWKEGPETATVEMVHSSRGRLFVLLLEPRF